MLADWLLFLLIALGTLLAAAVVILGFVLLVLPRKIAQSFERRFGEITFCCDQPERVLALTIDDGPDPQTTPAILDVLATHNARATFFVITERMQGQEPLLWRMLAEGHELGNHLTRDEPSAALPVDQLQVALAHSHRELIKFGPVHWFRPGSGWVTAQILRQIQPYGYRCALGSIWPYDVILPFPWLAAQFIWLHAHPGGIIILHDHGGRGRRCAKILAHALPLLARNGYRVVSLGELCEGTAPPSASEPKAAATGE